jgi:glutamine amidotransferase
MCRLLGYIGAPVLLEDLLYAPDSSLLKQTVAPQQIAMLNLAGFGLAAWDPTSHNPDKPFVYRNTEVAVFDRNLQVLSQKIRTNAVVAHLRGVPYHSSVQINQQNVHPFMFEGARLAVAHNGDLAAFEEMRFDLLAHIRPEMARCIRGSTDSEWIYALIVSALPDPSGPLQPADILRAIDSALTAIRKVRDRLGIRRSSSVNLVACDGANLVATRFIFDFGCFDQNPLQGSIDYTTQWYTVGRGYGFHDEEWKMTGGAANADSVLVASEPLTRDVSTWVEVPEYSALMVCERAGRREAQVVSLNV